MKIAFQLNRPRQENNQALVWDTNTGLVFEGATDKTIVHFPGVTAAEPFIVSGSISQVVESIEEQWAEQNPKTRKSN